MAAQVKLDPNDGVELAQLITTYCDKVYLAVVTALYEAVRKAGDDNHLVEELKVKFQNVQNVYNNDMVPSFNNVKALFESHTNLAEYVAKLAIDNSAQAGDVGTVQSGAFDAAKNL